jgi:hypothetical protein
MKPDYFELLKEHNEHSFFIDPKGLTNAMSICYEQGLTDGHEEILEWLSKMDYLSDNLKYIIEEWNNQNKKNEKI